MSLVIKEKSAYEPSVSDDGTRILVDRLWPRGMSKERLHMDYWAKSIAPSNDLRKWYGHDPDKWDEFRRRYAAELDANQEGVQELLQHMGKGKVTFLFGSKERHLNNAAALHEYLRHRLKQ